MILGQPDVEHERIDNPLAANRVLSFLIYGTPTATVKGLNSFPKTDWPNIPLLYYSYHIMAGLGTIFVAVMAASAFLLWRGKLYQTGWMLWILLCCLPFPYIANTAGWLTAETGRQPWLVYGLMRTPEGYSKNVNAGQHPVYAAGIHGAVRVAGDSVSVSDAPRHRARACGGDGARGDVGSAGDHGMKEMARCR